MLYLQKLIWDDVSFSVMMCMYGAAGGEGGSIHTTNHLSLTIPCKLGHSPLTFDWSASHPLFCVCYVGNARGLLNIEMFSGFGIHFFWFILEEILEKMYWRKTTAIEASISTNINNWHSASLFSICIVYSVWVSTRELGWFIPEKQYQLRVIQLWGQKTSIHARLRSASLSLADVVLLTTLTPEEKIMKHRMDILISYFMGRPHILTDYRWIAI